MENGEEEKGEVQVSRVPENGVGEGRKRLYR
jgi:hypothetical protein